MEYLTFSLSPSIKKAGLYKGDVYATKFTCVQETRLDYTETTWSFGDGTTIYNSISAEHTYNYPGIYSITLSAWSNEGDLQITSKAVNVDYIIRDAILVTQIPTDKSVVGTKTKECFTIQLTSAKINNELSLSLHSLNSNSIPYNTAPDKWNFLTQRWRFIDASTDEVIKDNIITVSTQPIYSNNSVIAVSSEFSFFYIDDAPTQMDRGVECPVILLATLSSEKFLYPTETLRYPYFSYSNNNSIQAVIPRFIMDLVPTELKVTENFINGVYPIKWTNVPVPIMVTCVFNSADLPSFKSTESDAIISDVFSYPKTNENGNIYSLKLNLSGVDSSYYTIDEPSLYFNATDSNDGLCRGYIFTTITPLSPIAETCVVASTTAVNMLPDSVNPKRFQFPVGFNIPSEVFISHPFERNINKFGIVPFSSKCDTFNYFLENKTIQIGSIETIPVPETTSYTTDNLQLSGTSGIYSIVYNPTTEMVYAADSDQNTILQIDKFGTIVNTVYVSAATMDPYNTPSCLSLAESGEVWVSLYDSYKVLKYSYDLSGVECIATPPVHIVSYNSISAVDEFDGPITSPSIVEVDREGDVWVCYSNPLSSLLLKYDSEGTLIVHCSDLAADSQPVDLVVDKENNVWVACKKLNQVHQYDSTGNKLQTFNFLQPSYITLDNDNHVWLVHGYNFISYINTDTLSVKTWRMTLKPGQSITLAFEKDLVKDEYPTTDLNNILYNDEIWSGLACDIFNRIWIVNATENCVVMFNKHEISKFKVFDARPTSSTNYIVETNKDYITRVNTTIDRPFVPVNSFQAIGDWTGNKWMQKFANKYEKTIISGNSSSFEVLPLYNNDEIMTMDLYVRDTKRSSVTFTGDRIGSFFGYRMFDSIEGDVEAFHEFKQGRVDLNLVPYSSQLDQFTLKVTEKSPNAEQSVSLTSVYDDDIFLFSERRNLQFKVTRINGSFSFADYFQQLALPQTLIESPKLREEFIAGLFGNGQGTVEDASRTSYEKIANFVSNHSDIDTAEIDKLVSLAETLSLDAKRFGTNFPVEIQKYLNIFSTPLHHLRGVPVYQRLVAENMGELLTETSIISAGEYIIAKDKSYEEYKLIFVNNLLDGTLVYPLSSLTVNALRTPILTQYYFFKYNTENIIGYRNSTLDWDVNLTAISRTLSSYDEWYKNDGVAELYFNNALTRGLFG
jgi:hypothetical protein